MNKIKGGCSVFGSEEWNVKLDDLVYYHAIAPCHCATTKTTTKHVTPSKLS
uniref:Uncharacterized protein n=1 Tax=Zea mays TaxID=4577 RepID=B8A3S8_MAIZE|nr:unknown [Zea mays]